MRGRRVHRRPGSARRRHRRRIGTAACRRPTAATGPASRREGRRAGIRGAIAGTARPRGDRVATRRSRRPTIARWTIARSTTPRAVPLAPGARAHRHPRRGRLPRRARARRRGDLARVARLALRRGDGPRDGPADRLRGAAARLLRRDRRPGPGARGPAAPSRRSSTSSPPGSRPTRSTATTRGRCRYFTPPPLVASIVGEVLAQWTNQGIDVWHAGPGRRVRRGGGRPLAVRPRRATARAASGCCTSGGVMANFIAMALVRDVHLRRAHRRGRGRRAAPRSRASASTPATRPTSRSPGRSTSSASRPRRWSSLPADDRFRLHAAPVAEAIARGPRRAASGPSPSAPSPARPTRARSTSSRSWRRSPRARACGSTSTPRTAARPACPRGTRTASPASTSRTASPSTPTSGSSRPTTSARCVVRDGGHLRQTFDRSPEYYRGGEAPRHGEPRRRRRRRAQDAHAGQLNFYKLGFEGTRRFRALKLWASWKHLGTSGLGRLIERTTTSPRTSPRAAPRPTTSRRSPPSPSCPSSASATCRAARRPPPRWTRRDARRPPGPPRRRARGSPATAGCPPPRSRGAHVPARRHRELPDHRGRHRPAPRDAPGAGGAACLSAPDHPHRTRSHASGGRRRT